MDIKLTFEADLNEINIILSGLAKLPLEHSLELFTRLRTSADAQVKALEEAAGVTPE